MKIGESLDEERRTALVARAAMGSAIAGFGLSLRGGMTVDRRDYETQRGRLQAMGPNRRRALREQRAAGRGKLGRGITV